MRPSGRAPDQMRALTFEPGFTKHAEGSCLVSFGDTRVLVTASVEDKLPPFLRGKGQGWVTAEYGMLPRATHTRGNREWRLLLSTSLLAADRSRQRRDLGSGSDGWHRAHRG